MAHALRHHGLHRPRFTLDSLALVEIVALAPLALLLSLWLIPEAFQIQWGCVGGLGAQGMTGDEYSDAVAVFGTLGWILVAVTVLFAEIGERSRLAAILPAAWFTVLIGGALVMAALVGPAPCPA